MHAARQKYLDKIDRTHCFPYCLSPPMNLEKSERLFIQRIDAVYHVRGESEFVDDMPPLAQMLYAAVFASPVAKGKILALETQAALTVDGAIAKIAETLAIPREEIQAKNLLQQGDVLPYGQELATNNLRLSWQEAETTYQLSEISDRIAQFNASHFEAKKGYAIVPVCFGISFAQTFLNQASALVEIYTDGNVSVSTGGVEIGQGLSIKIAKIAVKALGIDEHRIKVETTNTTRIANMSASAASVSADLNGNATLLAMGEILDRLKLVAVKELGVAEVEKIAIAHE